jgi:hypothetical protein
VESLDVKVLLVLKEKKVLEACRVNKAVQETLVLLDYLDFLERKEKLEDLEDLDNQDQKGDLVRAVCLDGEAWTDNLGPEVPKVCKEILDLTSHNQYFLACPVIPDHLD